jgi:hypothetical protein
LLFGGFNTTALAFKCESKKKRHSLYNEKVNHLFYKRLSPVLTNLVLARKQRGCLRLINCYIGRFLWALPIPAIFEKIE